MTHITKGGKCLEISQMDDEHLTNTIMYYLKKLAEAKMILDGEKISRFKRVYFGRDENREAMAEEYTENFDKMFPFYIFEAWIRRLDTSEALELYRNITGRNEEQMPEPEHFNSRMIGVIVQGTDEIDEMF